MASFNLTHYVPFVKAKAGEADALEKLPSKIRARIMPFFDVPRPSSFTDITLERHLQKAVTNIYRTMGSMRVLYVDTFDIPLDCRCANGEHTLTAIHRHLAAGNLSPIPVYGFDRDDAYLNAIVHLPHFHALGLCLRLDDLDISIPDELASRVKNLCSDVELPSNKVDIVIDHRSLITKSGNSLRSSSIEAIRALWDEFSYRSVVLSGSNYPRDITPVSSDSIGYLPRTEYGLWKDVSRALRTAIPVRFGDYGIVHPDFVDLGPVPNANAKIRYTLEDEWMITRGHQLAEPPGYSQYFGLARQVRNSPYYCGNTFSYGDSYIDLCAARRCTSGNLRTWVAVDMNHHLHYVTAQVTRHIQSVRLAHAAGV